MCVIIKKLNTLQTTFRIINFRMITEILLLIYETCFKNQMCSKIILSTDSLTILK